jgi:hypothetical protein
MSDIFEPLFRRSGFLPALLLLLLTAVPGALGAQETETAAPPPDETPAPAEEARPAVEAPPAPSPENDDLRRRVESSYEVLPVQGGLLLRPLEDFRGVRSIELTDGDVVVNGRAVDRSELRAWMGDRADGVLELADLDPDERRDLFDPGEPAARDADDPDLEEDDTAAVEADEDGDDEDEGDEGDTTLRRIHRGSPTVVGSSVRIASDEVADDVTVFGGSVEVDGRVDGDVTAFGGPIDIQGEVRRDVTAIAGNIRLGEDSEVGGEVTSVGGRVDREPGARVRGSINEQRGWERRFWHGRDDWRQWRGPHWSPVGWLNNMTWPIAELLFLTLLVLLVVAIARPTVERVGTRAGHDPLKSFIVGLLVGILFVPAFVVVSVLLAISIVGIPILIILVLLFVFVGIPAFLIAGLVGHASVAWRLGKWSEGRFGWKLESAFMLALVGLFFLHVLELVGEALDPVPVIGAMFIIAGAAVQFVALCIGFGAVVLELYDRRQQRRAALAASYPPPAPHAPPAAPAPDVTPPPPPPAPEPPPEQE